MNGQEWDEYDWNPGEMPPDDMPPPDDYRDDGPQQTDVACPFCGDDLTYSYGWFHCDNCGRDWAEWRFVERDPWDELTEAQQDAHVLGGGR